MNCVWSFILVYLGVIMIGLGLMITVQSVAGIRRRFHNWKVAREWKNAQTEPRCSATHKFQCWLEDKHPDITLAIHQTAWIRFVFDENNETKFFFWSGIGAGRTFVAKLLKEYIADGGKI